MLRLSKALERAGRAGAASLLVASIPSCHCEPERPYTPFHIAPGASASATAAPPPASAAAGVEGVFPRAATAVPKDTSKLDLEGVSIQVDPARVIDRVLIADFDGDGTKDAVAWTRDKAELADGPATGELVLIGGKTPAGRVIATVPPFVPSGPTCTRSVELFQTGPHTVALDASAKCAAAMLPRSPTRGLTVLAPTADRPTVLALRLADAAPGETLRVVVDSRDRDADGRDDVRVTFSIRTGEGGPEASADLSWLDRTSGPARDASEPARSLGELGNTEALRNAVKSPAEGARFDLARRLYATLCAESGTPRVFDVEGAPLACSDATTALAAVEEAEIRAAVQRHDALAAVAALARDGWFEAKLPGKRRTALEKELVAATDDRTTTELPLEVTARAGSGLPRFSPLAFEADGSLLVQTTEGVSRAHLPAGTIEDASAGIELWPLTVGGGTTPRWTGLAFSCDVPVLSLLESDPAGVPLPSQKTTWLAPRPGPCRHGGSAPVVDLVPIEWTPGKMIGLIAGGLFGAMAPKEFPSEPSRGSPRSPDGKWLVVPWSQGFLLLGGARPATWSATTLALSDCVVANGGTAVACARSDKVVVFTPSAEKPAKKKTK